MAIFLKSLMRMAIMSVFPWLLFFLTNARGPEVVLIVYPLIGVVLAYLMTEKKGFWKNMAIVFTGIWILTGVLAVFAILNITNARAFMIWFRMVRSGEAFGLLSYFFVIMSLVLSGMFGIMSTFMKPAIPTGVNIFLHLVLTGVVLQNLILLIGCGVLLVGLLAAVQLRGKTTKRRGLGFTVLTAVILITVGLSAPLVVAPATSPDGIGGAMPELKLFASRFLPTEFTRLGQGSYYFSFTGRTLESPPPLSRVALFDFWGDPGRAHYIRTQVYDKFLNGSWNITSSSQEDIRPEIVPGEIEYDYRIRVSGDLLSYVPYMAESTRIGIPEELLDEVSYQGFQSTINLDYPMVQGKNVYLQSGENAPWKGWQGEFRDTYLHLPESTPQALLDKADEIQRNYATNHDRVNAIREYFSQEFNYTLNPPPGPGAPLERFMAQTKAGYCVHFSTAFVLMARRMGIPARYVTGFRVYVPNLSVSGVIPVNGFNSHTWAEIILNEELGWQTVEATPPMMSENQDNTEYWMRFAGNTSSWNLDQLRNMVGSEVNAPDIFQIQEEVFPWEPVFFWAGISLGSLLILFLGFLGIRALVRHYSRSEELRMLDRFKDLAFRMGGPLPERRGWTALRIWLQEEKIWSQDEHIYFTGTILPVIFELREWNEEHRDWIQGRLAHLTKVYHQILANRKKNKVPPKGYQPEESGG